MNSESGLGRNYLGMNISMPDYAKVQPGSGLRIGSRAYAYPNLGNNRGRLTCYMGAGSPGCEVLGGTIAPDIPETLGNTLFERNSEFLASLNLSNYPLVT